MQRVAVRSRVRVEEVTLTLDRSEALALWHLLRRVGGPTDNGIKILLNGIKGSLSEAFIDDASPLHMQSIDVIGGQCTVRTNGLQYLDPNRK
jgi:hypothetical protein